MRHLFFLALCIVGLSSASFGQAVSIALEKDYNGISFNDFVPDIESDFPVRFYFDSEWVSGVKVIQDEGVRDLHQVLRSTLAQVQLDYIVLQGEIIVLVNQQAENEIIPASPAQKFLLSAVVTDSNTGNPVSDAVISIPGVLANVTTDSQGKFKVTLPAGYHNIIVDVVGFAQTIRPVRLFQDASIQIQMFETMIELNEVEVTSSMAQQVNRVEIGVQQMNRESIKVMPRLLGEADIIRSVLSLPGVKTVGEGASGFNVRGGTVDQNLILIDNAPLFNATHLFGLFSVVNPDIINSVTLHKGAMPARYGGRMSSVLNIRFDDGLAQEKPSADVSLGVISSNLHIVFPVSPNKTSIVFAGRGAYPDWVLRRVPDKDVRNSAANFYDATLKISHRFNEKNLLSLTGHISNDLFRLGSDTTYGWRGLTSSLQWAHQFSSRLDGNLSLFFSNNTNDITSASPGNQFTLTSFVENAGLSYDLSFESTGIHQLGLGFQSSYIKAHRGNLKPTGNESAIQYVEIPFEHGIESALYLSDAVTINNFLSLSAGIRFSNYLSLGPGTRILYEPQVPRNEMTTVGSTYIDRNKIEKSFLNVEPRLSTKLTLSTESSIKAGFSRNYQYFNLLSNTTAVSPVDSWKLSDVYLQPQRSDQFSAGYFRNFFNGNFEFSIEGYFKRYKNLTQYKEGARLLLNNQIETDLLQGVGKSYGLELYGKKITGKLTGWISYTYSRTFVKVSGDHDEETLSDGDYFPSNFDKPHDVAVVTNYQLSKRVTFSGNFVYSTGRPITYPESIYVLDGFLVANYAAINQARIPDYHRLDLSLNHSMLHKKSRRIELSWSLGIYNAYARRNPFSVFFRPAYSGRYPQAYQLSVLGTIIPYFSLNFKIK